MREHASTLNTHGEKLASIIPMWMENCCVQYVWREFGVQAENIKTSLY